jgi:hypothetical protein
MDVDLDGSVAWTVHGMLGAQHGTGVCEGRDGRGEAQEGLEQQRVERDQSDDRAARDRYGQAPAHGAI